MASVHIVLLLLSYVSSIVRAQKYDLSNPNSAERFFANSNIDVSYDQESSVLTWTAETPLAVGCGASVLVANIDVGEQSFVFFSLY